MRQLIPVHVECSGMGRGGTPFEHVQPPWIVREVDADMVGYEIEDQAEVVFSKRVAQADEPVLATEVGIELVMIDDVVAMGASRPRL